MTKRVWEDKSLKNAIDRLVMLALAHRHNSDRGCFPSLKNLEQMTQLSRPAICHAIRRLSDAEHIQRLLAVAAADEPLITFIPNLTDLSKKQSITLTL